MKWLSQFNLVMRSTVTSLREVVEDPQRMLHQLIIDMEEELDRVRRSVAETIADEIQLRKRAQRDQEEADRWYDRATQAMKRGDESTASAALEQKLACQQRADRLMQDHAKQQLEVTKLKSAVVDLEDKIRQAKHKKTLLTARLARATSSQKIHQALDRTQSQSAFAQFNRLEEKVEREESIIEAWDQMDGHDPDAAELERKFEADERKQRIADELAKLKQAVEK
jgi:phage shock protein A